jgi:hypothetical protein
MSSGEIQSHPSASDAGTIVPGNLLHVLPGRLFFTMHPDTDFTRREIAERLDLFFWSSNHDEYQPYCSDFGPVDLGITVTVCRQLRALLSDPRLGSRPVCYYTGPATEDQTNAAFILAAYLVLVCGLSPEDAWAPFTMVHPDSFLPFRDASDVPSSFDLSPLDCLCGLRRGVSSGFFSLDTFDVDRFRAQDEGGVRSPPNRNTNSPRDLPGPQSLRSGPRSGRSPSLPPRTKWTRRVPHSVLI